MEECGMVYMHAQLFNPAMKSVYSVRKALQVRTIFNLLGRWLIHVFRLTNF